MNLEGLLMMYGTVAIVILFGLWIWYKNRFGVSDLMDVKRSGKTLITTSSVYHSAKHGGYRDTRMQSFDLTTGKRNARRILNSEYDLIMIVNGVVWLEVDTGSIRQRKRQEIRGVNLFTLKNVMSMDDIKRKFKASTFRHFGKMVIDKSKKNVSFTTEDGFHHTLDFDDVTISNPPEATTSKQFSGKSTNRDLFSFKPMENSERFQLMFDNKVLLGEDSFLEPVIVGTSGSTHDDAFLIFTHNERLTNNRRCILTTISFSGKRTDKKLPVKSDVDHSLSISIVEENENEVYFHSRDARRNKLFVVDKRRGLITTSYRI